MKSFEKYQESLISAIKSIQVADHIIYVTYPLLKEKQLLLKALDSIYDSLTSLINSVLEYDYLWKRISLYKDAKENFKTFMNKCSKHLNLSAQDLNEIQQLLALVESHKKSPMEFLRKDKVVIMSNSLKTSTLDLEKAKNYLLLVKRLIERAKGYMNIA